MIEVTVTSNSPKNNNRNQSLGGLGGGAPHSPEVRGSLGVLCPPGIALLILWITLLLSCYLLVICPGEVQGQSGYISANFCSGEGLLMHDSDLLRPRPASWPGAPEGAAGLDLRALDASKAREADDGRWRCVRGPRASSPRRPCSALATLHPGAPSRGGGREQRTQVIVAQAVCTPTSDCEGRGRPLPAPGFCWLGRVADVKAL